MKLFFDIECASQYASLSECPTPVREAWLHTAKSRYPDLTPEQAYTQKAALHPEFGQIICISCLSDESDLHSDFYMDAAYDKRFSEEHEMLVEFNAFLEKHYYGLILVGHAIKRFDVPYLVTRFANYGMPVPRSLKMMGLKPWEMQGFVDTMEVWKQGQFQSPHAASLENVCLVLGVESPKQDIHGSEVSGVWHSSKGERLYEILEYCQGDVRANKDAYNRMEQLNLL